MVSTGSGDSMLRGRENLKDRDDIVVFFCARELKASRLTGPDPFGKKHSPIRMIDHSMSLG
jgi:hypothetical protein